MSLPVATAAPRDPHPRSWARLALKAVLVLAGVVAAIVAVALLGSHRADAATRPVEDRANQGAAPASRSGAPIMVDHQLRPLLQQAVPATALVRQTLGPVVQQLAPVVSPVRQTLRPVVQQLAPVVSPVRQTLRPVVQQLAPATTTVVQVVPGAGQRTAGAPSLAAPTFVATPLARGATGPWPIDVSSGHGPTGAGLRPSGAAQAGGGPPSSGLSGAAGSSGGPVGSSSSTLVARGATSLASSVGGAPAPSSLSRSSDGVGMPASTWPLGGGTVPTPVGADGSGHGGAGLSALLAARWLVLGLLAVIIGLIAYWSAGRPAPRPEVSPA